MPRYPRNWRRDYYPRFERRERLPAKDGIAARSIRGDIGESWWSKRFIRALEALTDGGRLQRGRSYARSGQVMNLTIAPRAVTAQVQGSRPRPYKVEIKVRTFAQADWERTELAMAAEASFLASLLAGEMPRDIERAFEACKLSLFPATRGDLETECSCPDWANPCKHVAAALYVLAERFDDDPFLIFAWRGKSRDDLLAGLRRARQAIAPQPGSERSEPGEAHDPDPSTSRAAGGARSRSAGVAAAAAAMPLGDCLDRFWEPSAGFDSLQIAAASHGSAARPWALIAQLGPAPLDAFGKNLADWLVPVYQAMAEAAGERLALWE